MIFFSRDRISLTRLSVGVKGGGGGGGGGGGERGAEGVFD